MSIQRSPTFKDSLLQDNYYTALNTDETKENARKQKQKFKYFGFGLACLLLVGFLTFGIIQITSKSNSTIELTFLAINDVYELDPTGGRGGLSRFASYAKELHKENPDGFITLLPGDFFSPSALGFAPIKDDNGNSTPLRGKQMVSIFNYISKITKSDDQPSLLASYGNHEFDIPETDFYNRLTESAFTYISSNVHGISKSLPSTEEYFFLKKKGITIAFLGLCINSNEPNYIKIDNYESSVARAIEIIESWKTHSIQWDILVALTHWSLEEDIELANRIPSIDLVIGGHEHENWYVDRGTKDHPFIIAKADSNAKTVFKHTLTFDHKKANKAVHRANEHDSNSGEEFKYGLAYHTGSLKVESYLKSLDESVPNDPVLDREIAEWTEIGYAAYRKSNIDPARIMGKLQTRMNFLDKVVRNSVSEASKFCADALMYSTQMENENPSPGVFNTGAIRIDDVLEEGVVREYDALRIWAFGGEVKRIRLSGTLFLQLLERGYSYRGSGDYLGYSTKYIQLNDGDWYYMGKAIVEQQSYDISVLDYMLYKTRLYFSEEDLNKIEILPVPNNTVDCQHALIEHFERTYPIPTDLLSLYPLYDTERITYFPRFKF